MTSSRGSATWAAPCVSGSIPAKLAEGSIVREIYDAPYVEERHRHRYEVNNAYREQLEEAGLWFSGTSPDGRLVEYVELPRDVHPVLRRHPGASRVPFPPGPPAPDVRRPDRGRGGPPGPQRSSN